MSDTRLTNALTICGQVVVKDVHVDGKKFGWAIRCAAAFTTYLTVGAVARKAFKTSTEVAAIVAGCMGVLTYWATRVELIQSGGKKETRTNEVAHPAASGTKQTSVNPNPDPPGVETGTRPIPVVKVRRDFASSRSIPNPHPFETEIGGDFKDGISKVSIDRLASRRSVPNVDLFDSDSEDDSSRLSNARKSTASRFKKFESPRFHADSDSEDDSSRLSNPRKTTADQSVWADFDIDFESRDDLFKLNDDDIIKTLENSLTPFANTYTLITEEGTCSFTDRVFGYNKSQRISSSRYAADDDYCLSSQGQGPTVRHTISVVTGITLRDVKIGGRHYSELRGPYRDEWTTDKEYKLSICNSFRP